MAEFPRINVEKESEESVLETLNARLSAAEKRIDFVEKENEGLKQDLSLAKEKGDCAEMENEKLRAELASAKEEGEGAKKLLDASENKNKQLEEDSKRLREVLSVKIAKHPQKAAAKTVRALHKPLAALSGAIADLRKEVEQLQNARQASGGSERPGNEEEEEEIVEDSDDDILLFEVKRDPGEQIIQERAPTEEERVAQEMDGGNLEPPTSKRSRTGEQETIEEKEEWGDDVIQERAEPDEERAESGEKAMELGEGEVAAEDIGTEETGEVVKEEKEGAKAAPLEKLFRDGAVEDDKKEKEGEEDQNPEWLQKAREKAAEEERLEKERKAEERRKKKEEEAERRALVEQFRRKSTRITANEQKK